ncbi:MAG: nickel pincer cofactor biosynthesis protein LarB [Candidatus Hydrothermarchaeota archaeon]
MIKKILKELKENKISVEEAERKLKLNFLDLIEAKLDVHRPFRTGLLEAIYGEGKDLKQIKKFLLNMAEERGIALATRVGPEIKKELDGINFDVTYNETARCVVVSKKGYKTEKEGGKIAVITAGSSDIPVAEECKVVAELLGSEVKAHYDLGVAGIHRLFPSLKEILEWDADVIVVVAGMEGTLASVVAGLVSVPVIGVPTSVGYGEGGGGKAAILSMLQSCSPLAVVNVDNGFGAGCIAHLIARRVEIFRKRKV